MGLLTYSLADFDIFRIKLPVFLIISNLEHSI